jgi:hypothetical protein
VFAVAPFCRAQVSVDFEAPAYSASAAGTLLTGQQGWYLPAVAGSVDFYAYTYAGNSLLVPPNPNGGTQFIARAAGDTNNLGRAQQTVDFSAGGQWTISWDTLGMFNGTLPTADNLGSFSLQPSTTANYFQQIMQWGANTATATLYNINYGTWTSAGGTSANITFSSPGAAWTNIPVSHWIHQSTTFDFAANQILSVSIQDLTAGTPATTQDVTAMGWYLSGGLNNVLAQPLPTDIRVFAGSGGIAGNISAWDNINVARVRHCGTADFNCDGSIGTDADIESFFACLSGTCPPPPCTNNADFNGDGSVGTDADIESFFRVLSGGPC